MKKIVTFGMTLALGSLLFVGCTPSASTGNGDTKASNYSYFKKDMSLSDVHTKIMQAGENAGWRMTEFKENAIIAEKIDGDNAEVSTIKFSTNYFQVSPENDDLKDAIEDALNK